MADIRTTVTALGTFADWIIAGTLAVIGTAVYIAVARGVLAPPGTELFGRFIYNYYFLSLVEGRFDIPVRIVTLEGHYAPDGTAYTYHGIAPLLTRALAWPFVDLREVPLARASVCFFAVLGTAVYQVVLTRVALAATDPGALRRVAVIGIGIAIWIAAPGLLLAANGSLYNEPISIGYAVVAIWIALLAQVTFFARPLSGVLVPMALCVAVLLHARVHVAVGLGTGTLVLGLLYLHQRGLAALREARVWIAAGLVVLSGLGFLGLNMARFGDPFQVSGSNDEIAQTVEYGFSYWSDLLPDTPAFDAFVHGTFHVPRILPNLFLYAFDFPATAVSDWIMAAYRGMSADVAAIRVEVPRIGFALLWAPWIAVVICAIGIRRPDRTVPAPGGAAALLVGTLVAAFFMLSYGTVTLRYRFELWPALIVLALLALPAFLAGLRTGGPWRRGLSGLALAGGLAVSAATAVSYSKASREQDLFSVWDRATCEDMVRGKGFAGADIDRLCAL
jgi:hypothetical protein